LIGRGTAGADEGVTGRLGSIPARGRIVVALGGELGVAESLDKDGGVGASVAIGVGSTFGIALEACASLSFDSGSESPSISWTFKVLITVFITVVTSC
jgi:hypothetical protein